VPSITNLVFLRRVNSRIFYEQMIGRATRLCPDINKEGFRIFDAVDLYPHLQNLTHMKPVVVNPSISFDQLVKELIAADKDAHRDHPPAACGETPPHLEEDAARGTHKFEATAGETPEASVEGFCRPSQRNCPSGSRPGPASARSSTGKVTEMDRRRASCRSRTTPTRW
jgi:type I restriction enzyme R subunit